MVCDEAGGTTHHRPMPRRAELLDHLVHRGPPPRIIRPTRALPSDPVVAEAEPGGDQVGRRLQLGDVAATVGTERALLAAVSAVLQRSNGQAVRREDHRCLVHDPLLQPSAGLLYARGQELDEQRVVEPLADESERRPATTIGDRLLHALDVRLHRHPGPVRGEDQANASRDSVLAHPGHALGDEGERVLHPEVDTEPAGIVGVELVLQGLCLPARDLEQREPIADGRVAFLQVPQVPGGRRPSAPNVGVIPLHVVGPAGRPIGHGQHSDRGGGESSHAAASLKPSLRPRRAAVQCARGPARPGAEGSRPECPEGRRGRG